MELAFVQLNLQNAWLQCFASQLRFGSRLELWFSRGPLLSFALLKTMGDPEPAEAEAARARGPRIFICQYWDDDIRMNCDNKGRFLDTLGKCLVMADNHQQAREL